MCDADVAEAAVASRAPPQIPEACSDSVVSRHRQYAVYLLVSCREGPGTAAASAAEEVAALPPGTSFAPFHGRCFPAVSRLSVRSRSTDRSRTRRHRRRTALESYRPATQQTELPQHLQEKATGGDARTLDPGETALFFAVARSVCQLNKSEAGVSAGNAAATDEGCYKHSVWGCTYTIQCFPENPKVGSPKCVNPHTIWATCRIGCVEHGETILSDPHVLKESTSSLYLLEAESRARAQFQAVFLFVKVFNRGWCMCGAHGQFVWVHKVRFRQALTVARLVVTLFPPNIKVWGSLLEKGSAPGWMGGRWELGARRAGWVARGSERR